MRITISSSSSDISHGQNLYYIFDNHNLNFALISDRLVRVNYRLACDARVAAAKLESFGAKSETGPMLSLSAKDHDNPYG
jgi:hypothetical protein